MKKTFKTAGVTKCVTQAGSVMEFLKMLMLSQISKVGPVPEYSLEISHLFHSMLFCAFQEKGWMDESIMSN